MSENLTENYLNQTEINKKRETFEKRLQQYAAKLKITPELLLREYAQIENMTRTDHPHLPKNLYEEDNILSEQQIIDNIILEKNNKWLEKINEELQKENITDGLTGIYNRKFLNSHIEKIDEAMKRKKSAEKNHHIEERKDASGKDDYYIIMIDINNFKKFNDTHGHQTGDQILQHIARLLNRNIRLEDIVARYGGDEFTIVTTGANGDIPTFADRIRKTIEDGLKNEKKIEIDGQEITPTISLGVAKWQDNDQDNNGETTVNLADDALYATKKHGRNCVYYFDGKKNVAFQPKAE